MIDTHIHIERGMYTEEWILEFVNQAVKMGLDEIYLLEHSHRFEEFAPMYESICKYSEYQKNWYSRKRGLSIKEYEDLILNIRQNNYPIKIKWGLEICYFPEYEKLISEIINSFSYDFATGSIHWVNGFGFDHKPDFWLGLDVNAIYTRYYELMIQLVRSKLFTGLAHPDSIKCFGYLPSEGLSEIYEVLASELVNCGVYAEQSGGLTLNYGFHEKGVNKTMLEIFKKSKVDIRCASDAHKPEDVGANIKEMQVLL